MDEKELTVQIGRRFRAFRVTQGLSQKQIAVILGVVTHSNISRLERGAIQRFGLTFLKNCQLKFGLSIDWLLTGRRSMFLTEEEPKVGLSANLSQQNGRKGQSGRGPILAKRASLQKKLIQLTASLARTTHLAQEALVHAGEQDTPAKRK